MKNRSLIFVSIYALLITCVLMTGFQNPPPQPPQEKTIPVYMKLGDWDRVVFLLRKAPVSYDESAPYIGAIFGQVQNAVNADTVKPKTKPKQ